MQGDVGMRNGLHIHTKCRGVGGARAFSERAVHTVHGGGQGCSLGLFPVGVTL